MLKAEIQKGKFIKRINTPDFSGTSVEIRKSKLTLQSACTK